MMSGCASEELARAEMLSRAEQPILADLRLVGLDVSSVWDLVNTADPYPEALPVLLRHLQRGGYPDWVIESLARALAVKPAVVYGDALRDLYQAADGQSPREALAVALTASATSDQLDDLLGLLGDNRHGDSRLHWLFTDEGVAAVGAS